MGIRERLGWRRGWSVDERATTDELRSEEGVARTSDAGEGRVVFLDENGERRRLPADLGELSPAQRDAAIAGMSEALGAGAPDAARRAAVERLTELRAAGKISEEQFHAERRRLESY